MVARVTAIRWQRRVLLDWRVRRADGIASDGNVLRDFFYVSALEMCLNLLFIVGYRYGTTVVKDSQ